MILKKSIVINEDKISLYSIAKELESAAASHADMLGVGGDFLMSKGIAWVLIRRELKIHKYPHKGQIVTVETWPGKTRHGFYPRRFRFLDEEGNLLISCACLWALMDIKERTMITSKEFELDGIKRENEQKPPAAKIEFPEPENCTIRTVRLDETDRNGHLNNAEYLKWTEEIISQDTCVKELWVEYSKEILPGEEVHIYHGEDTEAIYIKGITGGEQAFKMRLLK